MKIKTRLRLNTWISLVVVMLMMLSLAWSFWEMDKAARNENLIHELEKTAFDRISLRDDYLLYREERASVQWVAKSETLRGLMETATERFTSEVDKALLQEARKDFDATFTGFSMILEKHKREGRDAKNVFASDEAESRLIGQVFLKAYALMDSIGRLHELAERASTRARANGFALIIFSIVGCIIAMVVNSAILSRIIAKRLTVLNEGIGIIGGNLDYRINTEGDDELSALALASNEMAARLKETHTSVENLQREITARKQAEEALRRISSRQESLLSAIPDIIMEVDGNKVYTSSNQVGKDFFGEDVVGKEAAFYFEGDQDTYSTVQPLFNGDENMIHLESRQRRRDGEKRLLSWRCRVLKDENGQVTGALSSARDITERKQAEEEIKRLNAELEQRVLDRTAQLETANRELEAFSYSVSHDLRGPLRAIDGFSNILLEDYEGKLDAEGNRLLNVIRTNTQRMDQLITDLLALSRVSKNELKLSRVDMTAMAHSVYKEIASPEVQQKFIFTVAPLPDGTGDPFLLRQAWNNLLSNAIKYTTPRDEQRIEITGHTEEGMNIYSIRDTGVGFNPIYTHKLFGVFQRLHKSTEFEGNGVGLAIVQRIIHRHGGRVWAEGKENEGATFSFSLPSKEVENG